MKKFQVTFGAKEIQRRLVSQEGSRIFEAPNEKLLRKAISDYLSCNWIGDLDIEFKEVSSRDLDVDWSDVEKIIKIIPVDTISEPCISWDSLKESSE